MKTVRRAVWLAAVFAAGACAQDAQAQQPLWEAGLGVGGLRVPHYRGSDQSHDWAVPVPYFVYRGEIFKSDKDGTRAVVMDTGKVDLDVSFSASPPTRSKDNVARQGMADLGPTFEIGPNLNVRMARGGGWRADLRIPVRGVVGLGSGGGVVGFASTPVVNIDVQASGWNVGLQGGPVFASRGLNARFYQVGSGEATATRPAYEARGGLAGWGATVSASRKLDGWWVAG